VNESQFRILSDKMDIIVKLLALNAVKGRELKEQVRLLSSFGIQPKDIARMLEKTPNHIRVIQHGLRKELKKQESASTHGKTDEAIEGEEMSVSND